MQLISPETVHDNIPCEYQGRDDTKKVLGELGIPHLPPSVRTSLGYIDMYKEMKRFKLMAVYSE
jgi:hypothetical protein